MLSTIFFIIIIFYSIVFHEVAHGYAAYRNGDETALRAGRLTLNPLKHIDMFGSIIVPIISYALMKIPFGWAKPVPYNPNNIKDKKYAELEVASAGILVNLFLAFLSVSLFYLFRYLNLDNLAILTIFQQITIVNIFLAMFNLLPFPPADGFSIFSELFFHLNNLVFKLKNIFKKDKEYKVNYLNQDIRNKMFHVKQRFSNPVLMILIIFLAVNIFQFLIPYISYFINYVYSF